MKIKPFNYLILYILLNIGILAQFCFGQSTIKIWGNVVDKQTGQPLYRVNIVVCGTGFGTTSDENGYFKLENLLEDIYSIEVSHIGYTRQRISDIRVSKDQPVRINIKLSPAVIPMRSVEISAPNADKSRKTDVVVIDEIEIARSNFHNLGEVLEQVPGVEIRNSGGLGGSKKISIRGSQTNQVLVLLDGIPLNDELGGVADLSQIPVNMIEKIEVYKSGSSHRFGSGAIGGAVNITTQKTFVNRAYLNGSLGAFRFFHFEPGLSGQYRNFAYFATYNQMETRGDFPYSYKNSLGETIQENRINSDVLSRNLFLRLNYTQNGHQFSLQAQRMQSERGIPGKINAWTAFARANNTHEILGAEYQKTDRKLIFDFKCNYSKSVTENSNLYPPDAEKRFRRYSKWDYQYMTSSLIIQSNFDFLITEWLNLKLGYSGRWLQYEDENKRPSLEPPINQAEDRSHGFYLFQEWEKQFPWHHWQFKLSPVIRYDEMVIESEASDRIEQQWSPGISLFTAVGAENKFFLKSNLNRSFRVPTFADLFYQDVRVAGKPDLAPEKSRNWDIGLGADVAIWGQISGEIIHFQNTIDDLIVWRLGSYEVFRPFNTNAEITGQEYSLEFSAPGDHISTGVGYTRLEPFNKSDNITTHDKFLPYRARHSVKANFNFNFTDWHASLHYRNVGERFTNEANTVVMPPYQVWDANLSWIFRFHALEFTWKLSLFNALNEDYEIIRDMPLPLREWRLGISIKY